MQVLRSALQPNKPSIHSGLFGPLGLLLWLYGSQLVGTYHLFEALHFCTYVQIEIELEISHVSTALKRTCALKKLFFHSEI